MYIINSCVYCNRPFRDGLKQKLAEDMKDFGGIYRFDGYVCVPIGVSSFTYNFCEDCVDQKKYLSKEAEERFALVYKLYWIYESISTKKYRPKGAGPSIMESYLSTLPDIYPPILCGRYPWEHFNLRKVKEFRAMQRIP